MSHATSRAGLILLPVLLLAQAVSGAEAPKLSVSADRAGIRVRASDAQGLDSIEISCPELDTTYHSGIGGKPPTRNFQRSYALRDLFPGARVERPLQVTVTVRNIRGATTSKTIQLQRIPTKNSYPSTDKEN